MLRAAWMWGDANLISHGLAKRNPWRWSAQMDLEDAVRDLEDHQSTNFMRPVKIELRDNAKPSNAAVQLSFPDVGSATAGLRKYVADTDGLPDSIMRSLQQMLHSQLEGQSTPSVRWMWADLGAAAVWSKLQLMSTNDPLQWSEWHCLEDAILDMEAFGYAEGKQQLERPVFLQIKTKSPQCTLRYEERIDTAAAAARILEGILDNTTLLKNRDDFISSTWEIGADQAEAKYQEYALNTMQENGGCVGAAVRLCGLGTPQKGHQGIIQKDSGNGNFLVNWGMQSGSMNIRDCELLATADGRLHLAGISALDALSTPLQVVNDSLLDASAAAFEQAFKRLVECYTHPCGNYCAADLDMCDTVVEAMTRDMEQGPPNRDMQYTCCLMLWWIVHPHHGGVGRMKQKQSKAIADAVKRKESKLADAAKDKAMKANACETLARASKAFPKDAELKKAASDVVRYLIKDDVERREKALAAGWKLDQDSQPMRKLALGVAV